MTSGPLEVDDSDAPGAGPALFLAEPSIPNAGSLNIDHSSISNPEFVNLSNPATLNRAEQALALAVAKVTNPHVKIKSMIFRPLIQLDRTSENEWLSRQIRGLNTIDLVEQALAVAVAKIEDDDAQRKKKAALTTVCHSHLEKLNFHTWFQLK